MVGWLSLTELAESRNDGALSLGRVLEGHVVARAPRELGAQTRIDSVLDVALGRDVADFLLAVREHIDAWVKLCPLERAQRLDVANVAHGLQLVQVLRVVNEVQHEVVLHLDVERLNHFSLSARLGHSGVHRVLTLHELVILGPDLVDDAGRVDSAFVTVPVDVFALTRAHVLVVVVEQTLQLLVRVTGGVARCARSKFLHPVGSQVLVVCTGGGVS